MDLNFILTSFGDAIDNYLLKDNLLFRLFIEEYSEHEFMALDLNHSIWQPLQKIDIEIGTWYRYIEQEAVVYPEFEVFIDGLDNLIWLNGVPTECLDRLVSKKNRDYELIGIHVCHLEPVNKKNNWDMLFSTLNKLPNLKTLNLIFSYFRLNSLKPLLTYPYANTLANLTVSVLFPISKWEDIYHFFSKSSYKKINFQIATDSVKIEDNENEGASYELSLERDDDGHLSKLTYTDFSADYNNEGLLTLLLSIARECLTQFTYQYKKIETPPTERQLKVIRQTLRRFLNLTVINIPQAFDNEIEIEMAFENLSSDLSSQVIDSLIYISKFTSASMMIDHSKIVALTCSTDYLIKNAAINCISQIADDASVCLLENAIETGIDIEIENKLIKILACLKHNKLQTILLNHFNRYIGMSKGIHFGNRTSTLYLLGYLNIQNGTPFIGKELERVLYSKKLETPDPYKCELIYVLGLLKATNFRSLLIEIINKSDVYSKMSAICALAYIEDKRDDALIEKAYLETLNKKNYKYLEAKSLFLLLMMSPKKLNNKMFTLATKQLKTNQFMDDDLEGIVIINRLYQKSNKINGENWNALNALIVDKADENIAILEAKNVDKVTWETTHKIKLLTEITCIYLE